ncbi:MAG: hypothetical protein R3B96_08245 [Pirellulaceae bacterium]
MRRLACGRADRIEQLGRALQNQALRWEQDPRTASIADAMRRAAEQIELAATAVNRQDASQALAAIELALAELEQGYAEANELADQELGANDAGVPSDSTSSSDEFEAKLADWLERQENPRGPSASESTRPNPISIERCWIGWM